MSMPLDPTLPDLLRETIRGAVGLLHTSIPAVVETYDHTTQTATVRLAIKGRRRNLRTGEWSTYTRSPLARVPVMWPGGSAGSLTFDLAKGDPVLVLFAERDIGQWLAGAEVPAEPADPRTHDLSDALAIPQVRTYADPLPGNAVANGAAVLQGDDIRLGSSSATEWMARADLVLTELQKLTTWMTSMQAAFNTHTHLYLPGPGPGTVPTVTPIPAAPSAPTVAEPRSTVVRSL